MRIAISLEVETHKATNVVDEEIVEVASDRDPKGAIKACIGRLLDKNTLTPSQWAGSTTISIERLIE